MKIDRICFEQLYPTGVYANQRLRAEATIHPLDDITECYKELQEVVDLAFIKMNPQITWEEKPPEIKTESKQSATERMLSAINSCTELKVLESFKLLVKNNPEFQMAYDNKLQSLQK